jgi:radical SAM protein with 4Fe4S-binding SPASM domain
MMSVVLTDDPADMGKRALFSHQDCACDCQCACPTDGAPIPVLSLPIAYYLELTPVCNHRCPGCGNVYVTYQGSNRVFPNNSFSLDGAAWCDLITRLASHARQFKLTGGEPTLHPAFAEIVRTVERCGVPFTLFTNGAWSHPDALLRLLRDTPTCEGLLVSLHGPDAAAHEAFSGVSGSFDETVANVRRATEVGLDVAISMVINRNSWYRVAETLDLALSLGANHLVCNRYISTRGARLDSIVPSQAQLRAAIATVESLRTAGRPVRFGNCIPQCFEVSSSRGCTAGSTFATIDPWGRMRPCNHAPLVAGDLRAQSLEQVWWGETMARWRSLVPADCATCSVFPICHGGCRAQALLARLARDPLIRTPLAERSPATGAELLLYAGLRPTGQFIRRSEGSGEVLIRRSQVVSVPADCGQLVPELDGSLTLGQIERRYGQAAVDWIGALYQERLVTWISSPLTPGPHTRPCP